MCVRMLFIDSASDSIGHKRYKKIISSKELDDLEKDVMYTFEPDDIEGKMKYYSFDDYGDFGSPLPITDFGQKFYNKCLDSIEVFHPNIIMLYAGFVFRQFNKEICDEIMKLRNNYPQIKFGILSMKQDHQYLAKDNLFDKDEFVMRLSQILLKTISTSNKDET